MSNEPSAELLLAGDVVALVDAADLAWAQQWRWHAHSHGRGNRYVQRTRTAADGPGPDSITLHRALLCPAEGQNVDHINHDGLDDRRCNLRLATVGENNCNRRGPQSNNSSGFLGVNFDRRKGRWVAEVWHEGVKRRAGYHRSPIDAAIARDALALQLHGAFAALNFPRGPA